MERELIDVVVSFLAGLYFFYRSFKKDRAKNLFFSFFLIERSIFYYFFEKPAFFYLSALSLTSAIFLIWQTYFVKKAEKKGDLSFSYIVIFVLIGISLLVREIAERV